MDALPPGAGRAPAMFGVSLALPDDFAGWRAAARALVTAGIAPEQVAWDSPADPAPMFTGPPPPAPPAEAPPPRVPRAFPELAEVVIRHRDPARFTLLHRLLHRLQAERSLLDVATDPDVSRADSMARAVRRDAHKMHAFVRFREVPNALPGTDEPTRYVSWFEPEHHILRAEAGFFARRFAQLRWSILTPAASAHWDGGSVSFGPGGRRADAPPEDAAEELWRAYFAAIFNPARLKTDAMRAEMPMKYWKNLPEARDIPRLIAEAPARVAAMVERGATPPAARRQRALPQPAAAEFTPPRPALAPLAARDFTEAELFPAEAAAPAMTAPGATEARSTASAASGAAGTRSTPPAAPASPGPAAPAGDEARPAASAPLHRIAASGVAVPAMSQTATPPDDARAALDALKRELFGRNDLPPWTANSTQGVFGEGPVGATLMFVGEQPGDEEDLQGRPFVGPAGRLFNRALDDAGISRDEAYVTNAVKHFKFTPTGKRRLHQSPDAGDITYYQPFLKREIALVAPRLLVSLGATALRAVTGRAMPVTKVRGSLLRGTDGRPFFPTVHPSYLLRIPDASAKSAEYDRFIDDLSKAAATARSLPAS
ncbi:UdgX family uracil-DNA binding protein [Roseomonas sp. BN140053]|uniref:UdgX family uracil-DNA binding protein n=1 Tax=Roseomonas sp. BN140053 TaxID=3391898 RepID=UPI0039EB2B60